MEPTEQAVLNPISDAAIFLTFVVRPGGESQVRDVLTNVNGLHRSVGFRIPEARLSCVVGIGSDLWDRTYGVPRPAGLHPFQELTGARHTAPATPGDLLLHIRAERLDMCFELAQLVTERLEGAATVIDEVHGFRSFDDRDLLGFVDGTENPSGQAARAAVVIGDEDPDFTGGSYVITQKYLHNLRAWDALTVEQQEQIIGRQKLNDVEFPDDAKASYAHNVLNVIVDENGVQQQILRDNMPFGRVGSAEFGTFFIGYAKNPAVTEEMLRNMFLGKPEGNYDRILDFSEAVTGNLFFVPTSDFLDDDGVAASAAAPAQVSSTTTTPVDGSLAIGRLEGHPR